MTDSKVQYGEWIDSDPEVVISITTANLTMGAIEADAFKAVRVKLVDDNTTILEARHIETGALFRSTWTYVEENTDGK